MKSQVPNLSFGYSVSLTEKVEARELEVTVMFGSVSGEGFTALRLVSLEHIPGSLLPKASGVTAIFSGSENPGVTNALHELAQAMKADGGEEWFRPEVTYGDEPGMNLGYDTGGIASPTGYC